MATKEHRRKAAAQTGLYLFVILAIIVVAVFISSRRPVAMSDPAGPALSTPAPAVERGVEPHFDTTGAVVTPPRDREQS